MKKIFLLSMTLIIILIGCGKPSPKKKFRVGIVFGGGGLGDKSFNDSAFAGLNRASVMQGIYFDYAEPKTKLEFVPYLEEFAKEDYDLIIAMGFPMREALEEVSSRYPRNQFAIVDAVIDNPNVTSIVFDSKEGSFLVGGLAGLMTRTDVIGYIGAVDSNFLNTFRDGYIEGAQYVNPDIEVVSYYIGGATPYSSKEKAKELSYKMHKESVDIIYAAAGGSGLGLMEAVKEIEDLYAIGVDTDQDGEVEGKVLTSMMKRVDNALYSVIEKAKKGKLKSGIVEFGIIEDGVSTTQFKYTKGYIGEKRLNRVRELLENLSSGEIKLK